MQSLLSLKKKLEEGGTVLALSRSLQGKRGQYLPVVMSRANGDPARWPWGQGRLENIEGRPLTSRIPFFHYLPIAAGIILRLQNYLRNSSFNQDETWRAVAILGRTLKDLLTYHYNYLTRDLPVLPMGFALVEKILADTFGYHECVLRFFPFFCGIVSLGVFCLFARKILTLPGVVAALTLFAFCNRLVIQSGEFTQYSTDLLVALILCLLAVTKQGQERKSPAIILWIIAGSLSIFFSYPAIFILSSLAVVQILKDIQRRDKESLRKMFLVYGIWLECFIFLHWLPFQDMRREKIIFLQAGKFFMPHPAWSAEAIGWLTHSILGFFRNGLGIWPQVGIPLFAWGAWTFFRRDNWKCLFLILPFALALLASFLQLYPFTGRFLIFLVPMFVVFIVRGAQELAGRAKHQPQIIFALIIGLLWLPQLKVASHNLIAQQQESHLREVVDYFKKHFQEHDTIYLNNAANYGFMFYLGREARQFRAANVIILSDEIFRDRPWPYIYKLHVAYLVGTEGFIDGMDALGDFRLYDKSARWFFANHGRTWFLFADTKPLLKEFVLNAIAGFSEKRAALETQGAALYLYDFK